MAVILDSGDTAGEAFGLVVLRDDDSGAMRYVAPLDSEPVTATATFDAWWNDKVLCAEGVPKFSRIDLIAAMAHRDGGAHVDPRGLTKDYAEFKLRGAGHITIPYDLGRPPQVGDQLDMTQAVYPGDAASPSVLQIAWELLETLKRAGLPDGPAPL